MSPENSMHYLSEYSKSMNYNSNFTSNNIKDRKLNLERKQPKSPRQLFLSSNYFFSEKSTNTNNLYRNDIINNTLLRNKKLLSNIFCSISSYKKISNDEIKKKLNLNTKRT